MVGDLDCDDKVIDLESGLKYLATDVPMYRGTHICDFDNGKLVEKFRNEFLNDPKLLSIGHLGSLFENPVIESTNTVSLTLGILKALEFAKFFLNPNTVLPNHSARQLAIARIEEAK